MADSDDILPALPAFTDPGPGDRPVAMRRLLKLTAAFVCLSLVCGAVAVGWWDRRHVEHEARDHLLANLALIEEHMIGVIQTADQLIGRTADRIGERDIASLWNSRQDWLALKEMSDGLPQVVSVFVMDEAGDIVLGRNAFPTSRVNAKHREYYIEHAAGKRFHIGRTIFTELTRDYAFTISRRLDGPAGSFRGAVVVTLDANYLTRAYRRGRTGASAASAIVRDDGAVIARQPMTAEVLAVDYSTSAAFFERLQSKSQDIYRAVSPADKVDRVIAHRQFDEFPLIALSSFSAYELYTPWRQRTGLLAVATLLLLAVGMALLRSLLGSLDREIAMRGELKSANERLSALNARLGEALTGKDVLFREVHHRVTNNLQMISSLLRLQVRRTHSEAVHEALRTALQRIGAVALLHRLLYRSDKPATVDLSDYLSQLCDNLAGSYGLRERGLDLRLERSPCAVSLDRAVPIGLAVTEAITNAIKHAFPGGRTGTIRVVLGCGDRAAAIDVIDDGVGLPPDAPDRSGLGRTMFDALAKQAEGSYELTGRGGTHFRVSFPIP